MAVDRTRLPALGVTPPLQFPEIRRHTLSNGLRVWTVEHHAVPLVSFLALLPVGASADPSGRPGLAAIASDMSLARNKVVFAISSAFPKRPNGIFLRNSPAPSPSFK